MTIKESIQDLTFFDEIAKLKTIFTKIDAKTLAEQGATIAALGTTSNLSAAVVAATTITNSAGTYAIPAEPTGVEVDTAIDALRTKVVVALDIKADNVDLETLRTQVESRLDAIESKLDVVIAALKTTGVIAE